MTGECLDRAASRTSRREQIESASLSTTDDCVTGKSGHLLTRIGLGPASLLSLRP